MKKGYIFILFFLCIFIWLLTGGIYLDTINKPIKSITRTTGIYLFGKRNIYNLSKDVEYYNQKGQLVRSDYFQDDSLNWRHEYTYTKFDSTQRMVWLTGIDLTAQAITEYKYDSLNRLKSIEEYGINSKSDDTILNHSTIYEYDNWGRNYKMTMKTFSSYGNVQNTFIDSFDFKGKVISQIQMSENEAGLSKNESKNVYDNNGFLIASFGGLLGDSIYYTNNVRGKVLEKKEMIDGKLKIVDKYKYDNAGNIIESVSASGAMYNYNYDNNNRMRLELRPWTFLIFRGGVRSEYEFYE